MCAGLACGSGHSVGHGPHLACFTEGIESLGVFGVEPASSDPCLWVFTALRSLVSQ